MAVPGLGRALLGLTLLLGVTVGDTTNRATQSHSQRSRQPRIQAFTAYKTNTVGSEPAPAPVLPAKKPQPVKAANRGGLRVEIPEPGAGTGHTSLPATPLPSPATPALKGTASETGQGVRCPLTNCNKLFRNEKLLLMHVKHYHPEYSGPASPSVTELAFTRTRLVDETGRGSRAGGVAEGVTIAVDPPPPPNPQPKEAEETDGGTGQLGEAGGGAGSSSQQLPDTPRAAQPKSRPKRLRTDSVLSVGSEAVFTPPPSPLQTPQPAPPSYKLSRRRAQQLRSAPTTPPGETKVTKSHFYCTQFI